MHRDNWEPKTRMHIPPYGGTEPAILLRLEDMHALLTHQLTMCSHIKLKIYINTN